MKMKKKDNILLSCIIGLLVGSYLVHDIITNNCDITIILAIAFATVYLFTKNAEISVYLSTIIIILSKLGKYFRNLREGATNLKQTERETEGEFDKIMEKNKEAQENENEEVTEEREALLVGTTDNQADKLEDKDPQNVKNMDEYVANIRDEIGDSASFNNMPENIYTNMRF